MNENFIDSMANRLDRKISTSVSKYARDSAIAEDRSIQHVRAGYLQKFGSLQISSMNTRNFAQFGDIGRSTTVGP